MKTLERNSNFKMDLVQLRQKKDKMGNLAHTVIKIENY